MLMTLVALAVLPHSPILYRFVVSSVNRQHDHHLLLPLLRAPSTLSSSADTDEDEEDNETTTTRRSRRRRRTTTVTRFRSLALLWKTVRARSLSACWYRLPPRNDKLIYEAERTTLLFEQARLAPTKCCLFSFTFSHSPFSFSFSFPHFLASRERKRSGGAEAEAEAGTSYLVLSWYMRKSRSLASPKDRPLSHRQKDQIELSSRWYPHAERSKNDAGVNQSAVICILREWATKRPGPAGDDIEVAVRVCVQACARTDESVAAEFKQVFAMNEALSMQMIGARENGTRHHETRAVPLVRKTTMAMMHGRDIGSDQNISQSQSPYPYYQPPASIFVTRYGLTATGSERLSEHAISGRTRIPKVKDLVRETESTTFLFSPC
ncbi:hypothetical protein V1478_016622 [Vespula squamosa]|uniref:Uncharacterized protein n=1 Tax=Vespula squamosa TaxID=30214 RepID=A0ABD2A2Z8_VESSQ